MQKYVPDPHPAPLIWGWRATDKRIKLDMLELEFEQRSLILLIILCSLYICFEIYNTWELFRTSLVNNNIITTSYNNWLFCIAYMAM